MGPATPMSILTAEDDVEDQMLVREALEEARLANEIEIVELPPDA